MANNKNVENLEPLLDSGFKLILATRVVPTVNLYFKMKPIDSD